LPGTALTTAWVTAFRAAGTAGAAGVGAAPTGASESGGL